MGQLQNYVQYRIDSFKQARAQKRLDNERPENSRESYESGRMEDFHRHDEDLYEWKRLILTRYLRGKAEGLFVQMPDVEEPDMYVQVEWDKDPSQPRYLTDKGVRAVKDAIREEQRHRREVVGYWFGIVVGVIGALTGLVAAFIKV